MLWTVGLILVTLIPSQVRAIEWPAWLPSHWRVGEINLQRSDSRHHLRGVQFNGHQDTDLLRIEAISTSGFGFPQLHAPLKLRIRQLDDERFQLVVTDPSGNLRLEGLHNLANGRSSLATGTLNFGLGSLELAKLLPPTASLISDVRGNLTLTAKNDPGEANSAQLEIDDLALSILGARIDRIATDMDLVSLWPPKTQELQRITVNGIHAGNLIGDVALEWQADGQQLLIPRADITLNESALRLHDTVLDLATASMTGEIDVNGLDLATLSDQLAIDGLAATGWIGGSLPFEIDANGLVTIKSASLSAATPGIINYRPASDPAALAGDDEHLNLVRQALENFHYNGLLIKVDGRSDGAMSVALTLKGANPDLYGGYPLEFNLNLDGALAVLAQQAVTAYDLPDKLSQTLLDALGH